MSTPEVARMYIISKTKLVRVGKKEETEAELNKLLRNKDMKYNIFWFCRPNMPFFIDN